MQSTTSTPDEALQTAYASRIYRSLIHNTIVANAEMLCLYTIHDAGPFVNL